MEKETIDFDNQLKPHQPEEIKYWAVYDPTTGSVQGIYPGRSADDKPHKVLIKTFIAQHVQESVIQLNACYVDPIKQEFMVLYDKPVTKIDDVLHRIPNKLWSNVEENDLYIECYPNEKQLVVALTERFYGTRPADYEFKTRLIEKNIFEIQLLITEYNDPNTLYQILKVKIEDLIGKEKIFYDVMFPKKFSIYTKRFFKNYVFETK